MCKNGMNPIVGYIKISKCEVFYQIILRYKSHFPHKLMNYILHMYQLKLV